MNEPRITIEDICPACSGTGVMPEKVTAIGSDTSNGNECSRCLGVGLAPRSVTMTQLAELITRHLQHDDQSYRNEQFIVGGTGTLPDGTTYPVMIPVDVKKLTDAIIRDLPSAVRNATGPRGF